MRTDDFSRAPAIGQAGAMVVGSTRITGSVAALGQLRRHRAMLAELQRASGYRAHRAYWQPPSTLGMVAWFDTVDDVARFARTGAHPALADWVDAGTLGESTRGEHDWVRVYQARESGYTNGVWRAEGNVMRNIETFTPVGREKVGPSVRRRRRAGGESDG